MGKFTRQLGIYIRPALSEKRRNELFEEIWREYQPALTVFVRSFTTLGAQDIEDLVQEIMLKVYSKLHLYNPLRDFKVWIYSIARNHCIDRYRLAGKPPADGTFYCDCAEFSQNFTEPGQEAAVIAGELHELIESYLAGLRSVDRQISFLRFSANLAYKKIGSILGLPAGTVKYRVHVIRAGLRKKLERLDGK